MRIEALDIHDDLATARTAEVLEACRRHDEPDNPPVDLEAERAYLRTPRPFTTFEHWVADVDGQTAGYAEMQFAERENTHIADIRVHVRPESRRQGIGTALYQHCVQRAKSAGRTKAFSAATGHVPGGTATRDGSGVLFLERMGLAPKLTEVRRRLDLATVDDVALAVLRADARKRSGAYEVLTWKDRAPAELVEGMAYLEGRLLADAPTGDLDLEPEKYDAERWLQMEERAARALRTIYYAATRHIGSGQVTAFSGLLFVRAPRTNAYQITTIVDPDHRGHRLGMLVKLANLAYVRAAEPELRYIDTSNAAENAHMIAINEAMGFVVCDSGVDLQGEI